VDRAKIADIFFDSICFNAVETQTSSSTSKTLDSGRQSTAIKIKTTVSQIALKDRRIEIPCSSSKSPL